MRKYKARLLGVGLGALVLPACLEMPVRLVPEKPADTATASTVRRVAPAPATPPAVTVQAPAQPLNLQPIFLQAAPAQPGAAPEMMPIQYIAVTSPQTPTAPTGTPAIVTPPGHLQPTVVPTAEGGVEVVAVTHTVEPPLAPPILPEPVRSGARPIARPEMPTAPLPAPPAPPKVAIKPASAQEKPLIPPGAQVLVLQPNNVPEPVQPATHDEMPAPPSPAAPEELRMVTGQGRAAVVEALRAYQEKSPADAERLLASLDPVNQELLKKLLPLAVRLGGQPADPGELAEVADQMQTAMACLRTKAALRFEKLSYCRAPAKSARYGVYQPLPNDTTFRQGETVEVYMELKNFSCESKDQVYATHLTTVLEIVDDQGEVASRFEFERDKPEAGNAPRVDYFHICRFPVQGLATGHYTLRVRVTDIPTGKFAQRELPLKVESPRRTAARTAAH